MSVKPIDTYIDNSVRLFEANPSDSIISVTYQGGKDISHVSFRTHNPHLSTTYKFKTTKNKEVSRLLNALGPRGVSMNPVSKVAKRRNYLDVVKKAKLANDNKVSKRSVKLIRKAQVNPIVNTIGIGKLLANKDIKEDKPVTVTTGKDNKKGKKNKSNKNKPASTPTPAATPTTSAKSKKKNKNKKKR
ncbi:Signal recognition particle subunit SRP21 [Nakaseomyces bracarensis]|uniref:Signal recognition particle subunit SRP21 n=1 Tax=Nakaseomyces bracarensis TaxID=273131 RepID=A0ABR4NU57_9SACH